MEWPRERCDCYHTGLTAKVKTWARDATVSWKVMAMVILTFFSKYKWTCFRPGIEKNTISYTGGKWNSTRTKSCIILVKLTYRYLTTISWFQYFLVFNLYRRIKKFEYISENSHTVILENYFHYLTIDNCYHNFRLFNLQWIMWMCLHSICWAYIIGLKK